MTILIKMTKLLGALSIMLIQLDVEKLIKVDYEFYSNISINCSW